MIILALGRVKRHRELAGPLFIDTGGGQLRAFAYPGFSVMAGEGAVEAAISSGRGFAGLCDAIGVSVGVAGQQVIGQAKVLKRRYVRVEVQLRDLVDRRKEVLRAVPVFRVEGRQNLIVVVVDRQGAACAHADVTGGDIRSVANNRLAGMEVIAIGKGNASSELGTVFLGQRVGAAVGDAANPLIHHPGTHRHIAIGI